MSKKKIVIISTVALVIIIGIVLWFSTANNEASGYSYSDENITLGYVPDGMECISSNKTNSTIIVSFSDDLGNYFTLFICDKDTNMSVDTENGVFENIMINDMDGVYISTSVANSVTWYSGEYVNNISGNIQRDVLIRIAENIN